MVWAILTGPATVVLLLHSCKSADWVRGEARFISSAIGIANTGPA
jgi:hypothetical protein